MDTQVLIAGAGPVGLTLAIDLGRRGIRCTLIEKNDAPLGYPKMERCNPRTMEIFRRLGLAETVRAAGYPPDWPMDTYLLFDLMRPPLFKMAHPAVAEGTGAGGATRGCQRGGTGRWRRQRRGETPPPTARCLSIPIRSSRNTRSSHCSSPWRR